MKTRYIGTCAACEGEFKVQSDLLVHHGYRRPGYGHIVGDCPGSLETPHELSPALAMKLAERFGAGLAEAVAYRSRLDHATELTVERLKKGALRRDDVEFVVITNLDPSWKRTLEHKKSQEDSRILHLRREIERLNRLVATWVPKPLRSVEEEEANKRRVKEKRQEALRDKRKERLAKLISDYQKRIDAALRTRNSATLAQIFESAPSKLQKVDPTLTPAGALISLQRGHVWDAFGLSGSVYRWNDPPEMPYKIMLHAMQDRMARIKGEHKWFKGGTDFDRRKLRSMTLVWPEALGGEDAKGKRTLEEVQRMLGAGSPTTAGKRGTSDKKIRTVISILADMLGGDGWDDPRLIEACRSWIPEDGDPHAIANELVYQHSFDPRDVVKALGESR